MLKVNKLLVLVKSLEIGDIIKLQDGFISMIKNNGFNKYILIDKKREVTYFISNIKYILILADITTGEIYSTDPVDEDLEVQLLSFHNKSVLPIESKYLEVGDYILITTLCSIVSKRVVYKTCELEIKVISNLSNGSVFVSLPVNEKILIPVKYCKDIFKLEYEELSALEIFAFEKQLKEVENEVIAANVMNEMKECDFILENDKCRNAATTKISEKYFCSAHIRSVAALSCFSTLQDIRYSNRKKIIEKDPDIQVITHHF